MTRKRTNRFSDSFHKYLLKLGHDELAKKYIKFKKKKVQPKINKKIVNSIKEHICTKCGKTIGKRTEYLTKIIEYPHAYPIRQKICYECMPEIDKKKTKKYINSIKKMKFVIEGKI